MSKEAAEQAKSIEEAKVAGFAEETEGFPKRGTTLEGRVAQLLRLAGYNVSRNVFVESHEIDVYAENEKGKRIAVECKEYYTQLIPRDLILIFATKVRDINPDEAWFVTIYDFEPPARELCKRYGIRPINGYDLEELEDKVVREGIELGSVPSEDRLLRILKRQRISISREKRRISELRKVAGQVYDFRKGSIVLPPFLFPMFPGDLERKNLWFRELDSMPKTAEEGRVVDSIVNIYSKPLRIKGFRVMRESAVPIYAILAVIFFSLAVVSYLAIKEVVIAALLFAFGLVCLGFRNMLVRKYTKTLLKSTDGSYFGENGLIIPESTRNLDYASGDVVSEQLLGIQAFLVDGTVLGKSIDFVFNNKSWNIRGMQFGVTPDISKEIGYDRSVIPIQHIVMYLDETNRIQMRINAVYVLSDAFIKESRL